MNTPREEIYAALFAKLDALRAAGTLTTASRRLRHIEEVQPSEFPAAFQVQDTENISSKPQLPAVRVINPEWWLYVYEPDSSAAPSMKMNPLIDAIAAALDPQTPLTLQTLSGRVFHACVNGTIEQIEGVLGDRALAIIPIRITKAD